jgi:hypothetical protein
MADSGYGASIGDSVEVIPSSIDFDRPQPRFLYEPAQLENLLQEAVENSLVLVLPVAGVADLTGKVKTAVPHALAHGGFSDIYRGEWEVEAMSQDGCGHVETRSVRIGLWPFALLLNDFQVAIKVLRVLTRENSTDVRLRKVKSFFGCFRCGLTSVQRLNREVYVWHRLRHPNVAVFFGTTYHMNGRPAMVMQWYKYGSARDYLKKENPEADRLMLVRVGFDGNQVLQIHNIFLRFKMLPKAWIIYIAWNRRLYMAT